MFFIEDSFWVTPGSFSLNPMRYRLDSRDSSGSEPAAFERRLPGDPAPQSLALIPHVSSNDWRGHDYWRRAIPDLLAAYQRGLLPIPASWTKANQSQDFVRYFVSATVGHPWYALPKSSSTLPSLRVCVQLSALTGFGVVPRKGNDVRCARPIWLCLELLFTLDFLSFLEFPRISRWISLVAIQLGYPSDNRQSLTRILAT